LSSGATAEPYPEVTSTVLLRETRSLTTAQLCIIDWHKNRFSLAASNSFKE
jgi:hypothetical protein